MTTVLLRELSNPDIDWMLEAGRYTQIDADQVLSQPEQASTVLWIVLEGSLAALDPTSGQEVARLANGEMVGTMPGLEFYLGTTRIQALSPGWVLSIPHAKLAEKLQQDLSFAAHLYRSRAVLLAYQLDQLVQRFGIHRAVLSQPQIREGLTVFAELQDSDLDWLIAAGQVQQITANTVLIHSGRPVDALHILLDGALSLSLPEVGNHAENGSGNKTRNDLENNPVALAFSHPDRPLPQEFARLSRGEMLGEMLFAEAYLPLITVQALRDCQVLSVPRWRLAAKLLHDVGFASRFYRVLSMLLTTQYQAILRQLGQGNAAPNSFTSDSQFLTQVGLAEARFEWLLKRLQAQGTGREIQW